ncbi:unnamed protein product [Adineta ricciae]|nr:unnamed protein product [Adineta ricciae]
MGAGHRNLAIISDYMKHTTEFVYYAQILIINFIRKWYPNVKQLNYLSDGAAAHFKNAKNMLNLTYHERDFGLPASWTFSSTSHGKGPVDGIGAAVKSTATRHLLKSTPEQSFLSAEEFFKFTQQVNDHQVIKGDLEPNRPIEVFFINASDVDSVFKRTLEKRWSRLTKTHWIDGIQSKHQFDPLDIGKIKCRRTSTDGYSKTFQLF